jgi:hypothetical protein
MATWNKPKPLPLVVQQMHLKKQFPDARSRVNRNELLWIQDITPSPLSETYQVEIRHSLERSPRVVVLRPKLIAPEDRSLPHVYRGERLCLYYPGFGEWDSTMQIERTIVPWAAEWLLHYEIWLITGEWCGGGVHTKPRH